MDNVEQPAGTEVLSEPEGNPEESPVSAAEPETGFRCYICDEPSAEICHRCTRDTCDNHICERCLLCSDCCACDEGPR